MQNLEREQALHSTPAFMSALFLGLHTKPVTNSSPLFPSNSHYYESPQQLKCDSPHSSISEGIALGSLILSGRRKHYQGTIHHCGFKHVLQDEMTYALETKHTGNPEQLKFKSHIYPNECQYLSCLSQANSNLPEQSLQRLFTHPSLSRCHYSSRLPFTGSPNSSSSNVSS